MSKQSFTTGQVLTAAQVNSLQANDYNQTVSVKTASYVLVAADKGTRIEFNTSGSVTCTVNSGLFDAGDTLVIQNRGAGTATVTAGTATVNTSASLAISQYGQGILYFVDNTSAIFFAGAPGDITGVTTGATSGLTGGVTSGTADLKLNFASKGQLAVGTGSGTTDFLNVGTNGYTLVADSAQTTGLKWAAAGGGSLKFIQRTSFTDVATTGTTFDSVFSSTYRSYQVIIEKVHAVQGATADAQLQMDLLYSGTTQAANYYGGYGFMGTTFSGSTTNNAAQFVMTNQVGYDVLPNSYMMWFAYVGNASEKAQFYGMGFGSNNSAATFFSGGNQTARTYTGFRLKAASGNITGTVAIYGIATS